MKKIIFKFPGSKPSLLVLGAFIFSILLLMAQGAIASTLVLQGNIEDEVEVVQERSFSVPKGGLRELTFKFATPAEFRNGNLSQTLSAHNITFYPKPSSTSKTTDRFGNTLSIVTWKDLKENASVKESFTVNLEISLKDIQSSAPFPLDLKNIPEGERIYLRPTRMVQSSDEEIKRISRRLTQNSMTEQEAVSSILNWVVDNIKYRTPIPNYDAIWTYNTRQGNCQNFAHVSMALLRSAGIPSRIVGGLSLGKKWKVPIKNGSLVQSAGQGGHAWIEVWFPDLGWIPYDAQQSHLFVGPRHIKQTVGLDSNDVNDSWESSPVLPDYREDISAEYLKDKIDLRFIESISQPVNYVMAGSAPKSAEAPAVKVPAQEQKSEFGNLEFPELMDFYRRTAGGGGTKTFDKETAEYVTGQYAYAQAFEISKPMKIETVSLAMHKFGGRFGSLWVDIVKDKGNKPGMEGVRSMPLALDTVKYVPGYKWFDFSFSSNGEEGPLLTPGRFWIILRHSRDAVVSWFYSPGNRYGLPDDARSTEKGSDWSEVLNYDFNFKVKGRLAADQGG